MAEIGLGLGGNLGDPARAIRRAVEIWTRPDDARLVALSSLYETPPWGDPDQPPFVNACARVETTLTPQQALARSLEVEKALGRARNKDRRWGPRIIDVDLLFYDDLDIEEPGLTLPHPRMLARAFVMVPLAEIAPQRIIAGRRVVDVAAALDRDGIVPLGAP